MAYDPPKSPHDELVRAVFGTPEHMAEELRAVLPAAVAAQLDFASLTPLPTHFADGHLQGSESDLLFSARIARRRAFIYVLIEHQSSPDCFMALRLLRYVGRILDNYRQKYSHARRLPAVIPVVLCHDRRPWPYPLDLGVLFDLTPEARNHLAPYLPDFRFILDDLGAIDLAQLEARAMSPLVAVTLFILKRARHAQDLLSELTRIAPQFDALERAAVPDEQVSAALWYIWHVGRVPPSELLTFMQTHAGPKLESIMKTAREQAIEEGVAMGRAEGEAKGEAKALLKFVQGRFKVVPPSVESAIQSASLEQLERWIERVVSAETPEDVVRD